MPDMITWTCDDCGGVIGDGAGFFHISQIAIGKYGELEAAWKAKHPGPGMSVTELLELPDPVPWMVHHEHCEPLEESDGNDYAISLDELQTTRQMLRWAADLMGKAWISRSNLSEVLRKIGTQPSSMNPS